MPKQRFSVRLTGEAERELDAILQWSLDNFGERQAETYAATMRAALHALAEDLTPTGACERSDLARGYFTLHVARQRRRGRHVLIYRRRGDSEIVIVRILHDSMDISRHLPSNDE